MLFHSESLVNYSKKKKEQKALRMIDLVNRERKTVKPIISLLLQDLFTET